MFFVHRLSPRCTSRARFTPLAVAAACLAAACAPAADSRAPTTDVAPVVVDDFGDTLRAARPAARVVSLNPVISEAMFALRADDRLVGRTRWDAAPPEIRRVPNVGDGLRPNVEAVLAVRPDLVVLYAAEANRSAVSALRRAGVPTLSMRTDRVADLARALHALGVALGDTIAARVVADSVSASLRAVAALPAPVSVFWYAWDVPVITIGAGSYLGELIGVVGARNVFGDLSDPSPQVTLESVARRDPDFVLAGPRAAARLQDDPRWRAVRAVRERRVLIIDTTVVGRPGVRMGEAARSLRALLDSASRAR
ncbi:MAG: ABC transporter substrate-binding protein [Gemmatimonadetes bacterium]|nr:ABC transporter substrate-binding protein [Gemmatimonadota bacterium]